MRASSTVKHACVAARIGDDAKRGAANMSILASRATKCPAQGGAGSKRRVLGWRVVGRKRDRRRVEEGPRSFFRGSDLEGGRGRRAVPSRLISGRIPNLKLGPLLHLDSRPSGDAPRGSVSRKVVREGARKAASTILERSARTPAPANEPAANGSQPHPGDAHRAGHDALTAGSTVASPQSGPLLHVPPIPLPLSGGPCSTFRRVADSGSNPLRAGTSFGPWLCRKSLA